MLAGGPAGNRFATPAVTPAMYRRETAWPSGTATTFQQIH